MNLNKVFVIGRVTADPQMRTTPSGQNVSSFSIATNRVWKDNTGNRKEDTEFHNIVCWGRQAEIVNQFVVKGSMLMIEGRLQTRSWQDNQGNNRRTTEIICERLQLGPRPANNPSSTPAPNIPEKSNSPFSSNSSSNNLSPQSSPSPAPKKEENLPTINLDQEKDIKDEDLPF